MSSKELIEAKTLLTVALASVKLASKRLPDDGYYDQEIFHIINELEDLIPLVEERI